MITQVTAPAETPEDPLLLSDGVENGEDVGVVHVVVHPVDEEGRVRLLQVQVGVEELAVLLHLLLQLLAHRGSEHEEHRVHWARSESITI